MIHDNFFCSQQLTQTRQRAMICYKNINQTQDGSIHHNVFYGAGGMCLYYKDDYGPNSSQYLSSGVVIEGNAFTAWNMSNITSGPGANGSAVVIDSSASGTPDQLIVIGKNIWQGGRLNDTVNNYSKRGLEIVDNPDTANVVFDREQSMRHIMLAPYRINGVDYGSPGQSHCLQGVLTAPAIPASGKAFANPFGLDCTVYVSGRNLNDVAIDGVSTGLKAGMYSVPRCATITLTYSSPPIWRWFAA
jgi:hypothetical protein